MCIRLTLNRVQEFGLTLSIDKCSFCVREFEYLGFMISRQGIRPTKKNVEKITDSKLTSFADIRQFVGLAQFYRRWIPLFSQLVAPLYASLKFKRWHEVDVVCLNHALDVIKEILTSFPVLRHPDFNQEFFLATDGSLDGFGAILQQKCPETGGLFVIAYASCKLPPSMKTLAGPQFEAAAACWGMNKFRHYLIGRRFILLTDSNVTKYMKSSSDPPRSIAASALESLEFDYQVVHVPGPRHQAPDFMSRTAARQSPVDELTLKAQERVYMAIKAGDSIHHRIQEQVRMVVLRSKIKTPLPPPGVDAMQDIVFQSGADDSIQLGREDWEQGQVRDEHIKKLKLDLLAMSKINLSGKSVQLPCKLYYQVHEGLVCYMRSSLSKPRIVVPVAMWPVVFRIAHDKLGHRGVKPILSMVAASFYWAGMNKFIRRAVRGCLDCRRRKDAKPRSAGLTKSVLTSKPGEVFYIDFIDSPLPVTPQGYQYALVVVDGFTRYPFVVPLRTKTAEDIAENLLNQVFSHSGLPLCVHSDNEKVLVSSALDAVFLIMGVKRSRSAVRHPQGNSPAERFMRYLNAAFSITLPTYLDWPRILPIILYSYRVLPQETTGYSPFFMMYGREPLLPLQASTLLPSLISTSNDPKAAEVYVTQMISAMTDVFNVVRKRQDRVSRMNASRRDDSENRYHIRFNPGDPVLIYEPNAASTKTAHVRQTPPPTKATIPQKWRMKWSGPHPVSSRMNDYDTYKVYHITQHKHVIVNVDSMRLFHPFLEIPFSGIPQLRIPPPRPPSATGLHVSLPRRELKGSEQASDLKLNDLFLAVLPSNAAQPIALLRFLRLDSSGSIVAQWMGCFKPFFHIDRRMHLQVWHPGWFQPNSGERYFTPCPIHRSHLPFTNLMSLEPIVLSDVFLFNFELRADLRLPKDVADMTMMKYRTMDIAGKPKSTFENPWHDDYKRSDPHPTSSTQF